MQDKPTLTGPNFMVFIGYGSSLRKFAMKPLL